MFIGIMVTQRGEELAGYILYLGSEAETFLDRVLADLTAGGDVARLAGIAPTSQLARWNNRSSGSRISRSLRYYLI